jgi:hypothetical protein
MDRNRPILKSAGQLAVLSLSVELLSVMTGDAYGPAEDSRLPLSGIRMML